MFGNSAIRQFGENALARPLRDGHPFADELAARSGTAHQGVDAAALGVAEHNDVFDLERLHGEFQRGRHAGETAARLVGRYQVGHVTHDEYISGFRTHQQRRINAGVGTGNDRRLGALSLPKLLEQCAVLAEILFLETPETGDEVGDVFHGFLAL